MLIKKLTSILLVIVMIVSCVPFYAAAATSTYQLVADSVEIDGSADKTVNVYFQSVESETTSMLQADWSIKELGDTNFFKLTTLTPAAGATPTENNATNGSVRWVDSTMTGVSTGANGTIWTATYTVSKDTPAGTYNVSLTGKTTDKTYGENNFGTLTATITVTEPAAPSADYEIYYTLNSTVDTVIPNKYMEYDIDVVNTVTAEILLKNNTGSDVTMQAYDIYLEYDPAELIYQSESLAGTALVDNSGTEAAQGATVTHIQLVKDTTTIPLTTGEPKSLGTITFAISEGVEYGQELEFTLKVAEDTGNSANAADVTNFSVGSEATGDAASYYPADTSAVDGAEVTTQYEVSFDTDGGSEVPAQLIGYNQTATKPENPTKAGFSFQGWYTDSTYATAFDFSNTKITEATTIYAKWEQDTFTVTWYASDNTTAHQTDTVASGAGVTAPSTNPEKVDTDEWKYTFLGWNTDSAATEAMDLTTVVVSSDLEFYPIYSSTKQTYTITWENEDGIVLETDENVEYGATPSYDSATPTKASTVDTVFTFDTWSPAVSAVTGDITYTATYIEAARTYTVTFETEDKGTLTNGGEQTIAYGSTLTTIPTATPAEGYHLDGWYVGDTKIDDIAAYTVTGEVTLTAKYAANTYTVVFNANGGDGEAMAPMTFTYDVAQDLTDNTYIKENANFAGWKVDNAGDLISDGASVKNLTAVDGATVTLYAQWTELYTVKIDGYTADEGSVTASPEQAAEGTEITLTATAQDGYEFAGYTATYIDADGNEQDVTVTDGKFNMPAGNVTVTATFQAIDYIVTIGEISNGSVAADKTTANVGDVITLTPTAAEGYQWASYKVYHTDAEVNEITVTDNQFTMPAANVTVTATFTGIPYEIKFDCNGGNTATMESIQTAYGDTVTLPANTFTKTGYTFAGWDTDPNAVTATYGDQADVSNLSKDGTAVTLYAIWTPNTNTKYVVEHYWQDINDKNELQDTYTLQERKEFYYTTDSEVTPAVNPYPGFISPELQTVTIAADGSTVVVYKYNRDTYKINLGHNYPDSPVDNSITVYYGGTYLDLTSKTPDRDGYTFLGWFTESTGGTQVDASDTVGVIEDREQTLYAHWEATSYTITFDFAGGEIASDHIWAGEYDVTLQQLTYTVESTDVLPEAVKPYHEFAGWKVTEIDEDSSWPADAVIEAGKNVNEYYGNVTLTAQWTRSATAVVEQYKYAADGYWMLIVSAADMDGTEYQFNDEPMYYIDDENYAVNGVNQVFYTLISEDYLKQDDQGNIVTELSDEGYALLKIESCASRTTIEYNNDINGDTVVNIADANIVYQMIENGGGYYGDQLTIEQRLKADTDKVKANTEHRGSLQDVDVIVNMINGVTTTTN